MKATELIEQLETHKENVVSSEYAMSSAIGKIQEAACNGRGSVMLTIRDVRLEHHDYVCQQLTELRFHAQRMTGSVIYVKWWDESVEDLF